MSGDDIEHFDAPARLAALLTSWKALELDARAGPAGQALVAEMRGIGKGAAFVGGWQAMQRLDKAVAAAGVPTDDLNDLWDGIGCWVA